jgi:hypothetical protein
MAYHSYLLSGGKLFEGRFIGIDFVAVYPEVAGAESSFFIFLELQFFDFHGFCYIPDKIFEVNEIVFILSLQLL